jgi:hypothetical protein
MKAFAKDFFDNFKNYSAIISGLAFFICLIISLSSTSRLFASFGIDFFANAELGDYIILGVRKITSSLESFFSSAMIIIVFNTMFDIVDTYITERGKSNTRVINHKIVSFVEQLRVLDNPIARITLFLILSTLLIITNTSTLNPKAIKYAETDIKSLRYGKNETELKCVIFIGDTGSFSHYWSITDRSVKSINTSSIQIIETMFEAARNPYLTFTQENPEPEREIGPTSKPPRYPLTSPFYDKWKNEMEERTTNITNSCIKISKDILQ